MHPARFFTRFVTWSLVFGALVALVSLHPPVMMLVTASWSRAATTDGHRPSVEEAVIAAGIRNRALTLRRAVRSGRIGPGDALAPILAAHTAQLLETYGNCETAWFGNLDARDSPTVLIACDGRLVKSGYGWRLKPLISTAGAARDRSLRVLHPPFLAESITEVRDALASGGELLLATPIFRDGGGWQTREFASVALADAAKPLRLCIEPRDLKWSYSVALLRDKHAPRLLVRPAAGGRWVQGRVEALPFLDRDDVVRVRTQR